MPAMQNRIILALDVSDVDAAVKLAQDTGPAVWGVKIGSELFTTAGPEIVRRIRNTGTKVFLDLKLPLKTGHEVLAWIRQQEELKSLVVVVMTSSNEPSDLAKSYQLGANSYVVKPPTPEQLKAMALAFKWYWLEFNRF